MSLISDISLRKDEDFPAMKKKKSRSPKPRDKWSLLWFIPSNVLNLREEGYNEKGQIVKKGKRHGFDRFNELSCKVCKKAFHKYQNLAFHMRDKDHGRLNQHSLTKSVQPTSIKRNSLSTGKSCCEPVRKSSRVNMKPVSYDDDIEILDDSPNRSKISSINPTKRIDEKKFGKLSLSAKRKIVVDYNQEDDELENQKVPVAKRNKKKSASTDIEVIDIDEETDQVNTKCKSGVRITKKEDEDILLSEDGDNDRKRKSITKLQTPIHKKVKTSDGEYYNDMIEVKSSSGKSMFVNKATLEKIMASKKAALSKKRTIDEKLLVEDIYVKSLVAPPKKIRSRGF